VPVGGEHKRTETGEAEIVALEAAHQGNPPLRSGGIVGTELLQRGEEI
jgi:hypothetical protein